jgi:hypothetical protein
MAWTSRCQGDEPTPNTPEVAKGSEKGDQVKGYWKCSVRPSRNLAPQLRLTLSCARGC